MPTRRGPVLPHTRISPMARICIQRALPAPGEILVRTGERVDALKKIARATPRGETRVVNVARILGLDDPDLSRVMVKKRGDRVEAGETIAARRGVLPLLHKPCRSPIAGRLAAMSHGWVVIEAEAEPIDLMAFVYGQVVAITDNRSVIIETTGAHIVGACSVGGEGNGVLQVPVEKPTDWLAPDDIGLGSNNAVLVGGAGVSPEVLERAREMRVSGMIVGSISESLRKLTPPPFPIVATEGYGDVPMSPAVFEILQQLEGRETSISGRMGKAWDDIRPAIIVPLAEYPPGPSRGQSPGRAPVGDSEGDAGQDLAGVPALQKSDVSDEPAQAGDRVRAIRQPLLGKVGEILALSERPQRVPSGLSLTGAQVAFAGEQYPSDTPPRIPAGDFEGSVPSMRTTPPWGTVPPTGTTQFVPWLNLERIS